MKSSMLGLHYHHHHPITSSSSQHHRHYLRHHQYKQHHQQQQQHLNRASWNEHERQSICAVCKRPFGDSTPAHITKRALLTVAKHLYSDLTFQWKQSTKELDSLSCLCRQTDCLYVRTYTYRKEHKSHTAAVQFGSSSGDCEVE